VIEQHSNSTTRWPGMAALVGLSWIVPAMLNATPSVGFSSQTFRAQVPGNVLVPQPNPGPLFALIIQSGTSPAWGIDVVPGTTQFAAMTAAGPSQSGWHDHPTLVSVGVVVSGTVWEQKPNLNCLTPHPAGTVFFERRGEIHNVYNLDALVPAEVRVTHFIERGETATRRDQPDPMTGSTSVASPPPPVCAAGAPSAEASDGRLAALAAPFKDALPETDSPELRAIGPDRRRYIEPRNEAAH